jgi:hypothetical protein
MNLGVGTNFVNLYNKNNKNNKKETIHCQEKLVRNI